LEAWEVIYRGMSRQLYHNDTRLERHGIFEAVHKNDTNAVPQCK
jgi:hypothetical protein